MRTKSTYAVICALLLGVSAFADDNVAVKKNRISIGGGLPINLFISLERVTHQANLSIEYERDLGRGFSAFVRPGLGGYIVLGRRMQSPSLGEIYGKEIVPGIKFTIPNEQNGHLRIFAGYGPGIGNILFKGLPGFRSMNGFKYRVATVGLEIGVPKRSDSYFITLGAHLTKVFYDDDQVPVEAQDGFFTVSLPMVQFKVGVPF